MKTFYVKSTCKFNDGFVHLDFMEFEIGAKNLTKGQKKAKDYSREMFSLDVDKSLVEVEINDMYEVSK